MNEVRAKFKCNSIEETEWNKNVKMTAVVGQDGENKDFNDATPSGEFVIGIHGDVPAADFFTVGKEYYFDISEADQ